MSAHMSAGFDHDEFGFYVAACACGWSEGALPDLETMIDSLMQHAGEQGWIEAMNQEHPPESGNEQKEPRA